MIISASRRCDIPAHSMDWFLQRLKDGYVIVANPFRHTQKKTVSLVPGDAEGIVFWSKNPEALLDCQEALAPYPFYVQFTLNAYDNPIEPLVPPLERRLDTARKLVDAYGFMTVCPRYDPVILSEQDTVWEHIGRFERLCGTLDGYSDIVTISFLDIYRKIQKAVTGLGLRSPDIEERKTLLSAFTKVAKSHGMVVAACVEPEAVVEGCIRQGRCVDAGRLSKIAGRIIAAGRDKNQRPGCGCDQSVDIGEYGHCPHQCVYCYARK